MKVRIILDMDGTIADLYNRKHWLFDIVAEKEDVFRCLGRLPETANCHFILAQAWAEGYISSIVVATWTPRNVSEKYIERVKEEKIEWLMKEGFSYVDNIYIQPYGTPKSKAKKEGFLNILFDDNEEIRKEFEESENCIAFEPKDIYRVLDMLRLS
jgi:hypothetical protein